MSVRRVADARLVHQLGHEGSGVVGGCGSDLVHTNTRSAKSQPTPYLAFGTLCSRDEPLRHSDRTVCGAINRRVPRPALRDALPVQLEGVVEAETGTADVDASHPNPQPVVEAHRLEVAQVRLSGERFDATLLHLPVSADVLPEPLDSCRLAPDEEGGVMSDALRVGLGEPDRDLRRESISLHLPSIRSR